jgi:hypothetical protein
MLVRRRDPSIRALGFGCFRLLQIPGRADCTFVPSTGRNAMAAFARLVS